MSSFHTAIGAALAVALATPSLAAGPITVTTKVMTQTRSSAADGTTRIALAPVSKIVPGDAVVYQIAYQNTGKQPITDFVLSNPLPPQVEYRAPANGSPAPDLSVDGTAFGPLAALRVKTAAGFRPATPSDVKIVRWRLSQPVAAGSKGQMSFQAVLK
jgi:uncharacterized repeat protein (TIGR01451 family)